MIDQHIQNYKIISLLGEGGMGDVYLAQHLSIQRKVAIKVLKPELVKNEEIRLRFKNEASMLAHLQHPHIVGLIDYIEQDGGLYLIMEYVEGQGLDELVKAQHAPLSIDRATNLMKQILQAFFYAHKNGIIHRDVKPSNIIVTVDDQIKVLDFGIAKLVGDTQHNLTKTGTQIGTVYYMSPEQVKGKELDHRSDIYSLGVTFYELLSGVCPYKGMTTEYEIYDNIVKEPLLPLIETMGKEYATVWNIIEKSTQKEVENRFQNCGEFIDSFDNDFFLKKKNDSNRELIADTLQPQNKSNTSPRLIFISIITLLILVISYLVFSKKSDEDLIDYPLNAKSPSTADSTKVEAPIYTERIEENLHFDAESIISNFLLAEDNRDFEQIFSFYSSNLKRYWDFKYPSKSKLNKEYIASWNRTSYSRNTVQNIVKIDDFTFDFYIDFEFLQYNHENAQNVQSVIRFVLDKDGKIVELFGV